VIIHFTRKFEYLQAILASSSFKVMYCGEYFGDKTGKVISRAAHPMVSFSEYPDKELHSKYVTYGGYGIALEKEWATKNGLSPVSYVEKNSPAAQGLVALLKARQSHLIPNSLRLPIIQLKCFTKHVYGYNSYFKEHEFDFKAENEWRFVPTRKQIGGNRISENFSTYEKNRDKYNKRLEKYPLRFELSDIAFVYVESEIERQNVISDFGLEESKVKIRPWKEKSSSLSK